MRILLVAAPGAGKGTQAELLAAHYGVAHLSSGDLFRQEVGRGTELGQEVTTYLNRGDLVPDELVLQMLAAPILEAAGNGGYVLDGFPRSLGQAQAAYEVARQIEGVELQAVVHLEVPPPTLRERLLSRAAVEGRSDDNEATISRRLEVYQTETRPLLAFYAARHILVDIDGDQAVEDVFHDIVDAIDARRPGLR